MSSNLAWYIHFHKTAFVLINASNISGIPRVPGGVSLAFFSSCFLCFSGIWWVERKALLLGPLHRKVTSFMPLSVLTLNWLTTMSGEVPQSLESFELSYLFKLAIALLLVTHTPPRYLSLTSSLNLSSLPMVSSNILKQNCDVDAALFWLSPIRFSTQIPATILGESTSHMEKAWRFSNHQRRLIFSSTFHIDC